MLPLLGLGFATLVVSTAFGLLFDRGIALTALLTFAGLALILPLLLRVSLILRLRSTSLLVSTVLLAALPYCPRDGRLEGPGFHMQVPMIVQI